MGNSELEAYREQFQSIADEAQELTRGLDEARFNWRPSASQWSIEECLAHLIAVGSKEVIALEEAIGRGKERGLTGNGPFSPGPIERFILGMTEPPVRQPMSAPLRFRPLHGQPVTAVLPTFLHLQSQLMLRAESAAGLDLRRVKVATPVSRFVRLSLGAMFAQIAAHERRHLDQARRVRRQLL
ncbi:MAG TPA: DinB family protein [Verrucomicrobiae bacterium]|nr:DinB family protein [Verrucomicrobiae bacterium]